MVRLLAAALAGLGIACGLADWIVVTTGLALALIILIVLKRFERHVADNMEQH
jgi:uncharacterized membrane protein YhiD involved in acid resistance